MRNRKFIYAALALVTLGLTACQQEEDFAPQEQEINLNITAGGVQTRVNPLGTGDLWENNHLGQDGLNRRQTECNQVYLNC